MAVPNSLPTKFQSAGRGDRTALDDVCSSLYDQLHDIAASQMSRESRPGLLQTTAVVHEAWFRLSRQRNSSWCDRNSFLAAAANVMRRVLIDSARAAGAQRRGGDLKRQRLTDTRLSFHDSAFEAVEIDDALQRLAEFAPESAQALELMIFGGMTGDETANALGVSPSTIDRRLRVARAWLRRELGGSTETTCPKTA